METPRYNKNLNMSVVDGKPYLVELPAIPTHKMDAPAFEIAIFVNPGLGIRS